MTFYELLALDDLTLNLCIEELIFDRCWHPQHHPDGTVWGYRRCPHGAEQLAMPSETIAPEALPRYTQDPAAALRLVWHGRIGLWPVDDGLQICAAYCQPLHATCQEELYRAVARLALWQRWRGPLQA